MLNLLIREDRYKIRREYLFRYANVFLMLAFVLSLSLILLWIILLKTTETEFVLYQEQNQKLENSEIVKLKKEYTYTLDKINTTHDLFIENKNNPTQYLEVVENSLVSGINIESFDFNFLKDSGKSEKIYSMKLSGISSRRDNLLAFTKRLEENPKISEVVLPFSNFVKEEDLNFSIDIFFNLESDE